MDPRVGPSGSVNPDRDARKLADGLFERPLYRPLALTLNLEPTEVGPVVLKRQAIAALSR
jgi:hypothetical protein